MAKNRTLLEVFLASPSDVTEERTLLEEVIQEFNRTWGDSTSIALQLLKWETDTYPGFGTSPQDVVNSQIGDDYDIFIGIMWGRFGTPTTSAGSGTEEEFNRAFARLSNPDDRVQVLFYFKDAGIAPSKLDAEQLGKVQAFKKRIWTTHNGLSHDFETPDQFQKKARIHLSSIVQRWIDANNTALPEIAKRVVSLSTFDVPTADPLANLSALDATEYYEEGIIELFETANDAMLELKHVIERMVDATTDLGARFTERKAEIDAIAPSELTIAHSKRISNKAADDLDLFVNRMSVEIKELNKQSAIAMDTFGNLSMLSARELNGDDSQVIPDLRRNMRYYTDAISTCTEQLFSFRNIISNLPRATGSFNRSRKRAAAVLDDLIHQLNVAAEQSTDIESLLVRLEESK